MLAATDPGEPVRRDAEVAVATISAELGESRGNDLAALRIPSDVVDAGRGPTRTVGATVILVNGALAAYLARGDRQLAHVSARRRSRSDRRPRAPSRAC